MTIRESIALSSLTTLKVGGIARYVIECENDDDLRAALTFAVEKKLPWYVFGKGSNLLASDAGYEGVVIHLRTSAFSIQETQEGATVIADAGLAWDTLVREVGARGLWGMENLAGIPGTVGAAPVQNIGAYGADIADTLLWVEVLNPTDGKVMRLLKEACELGYRDSRFKRERLIILRVAFTLSKQPNPHLGYKDVAKLVADGAVLDTPEKIADAVRAIRAKKFPDLSVLGTAGSFFKNPILSEEAYAALRARYPELPGFQGPTGIKVPLAWILDNVLSLRGFSATHVRLFEAQPLVVVAEQGARAEDVEALAQEVATRVFDATGITLEWEVRKVS